MLAKKILIIDDDPDFVTLLKTHLTAAGYEVTTAGNGKDGFSQIIIADPDLIILDVIMPVMNGFQFMEKYRENAKLHKIPVFVVTAKKSMRDFFSDMPIKDFITKPLDMAAFMGQIEKLYAYAGLSSRSPVAAALLTIFLLSLAGIPPLAGFLGKYYVFAAAIQSKFITLAIVAAVNSVIAAYYYFRIVRVMYLAPATAPAIAAPSRPLTLALWVMLLGVLAMGIFPDFFIVRILG